MSQIIPIYARHFVKCKDERFVILRGSSRSAKTYSVLQWFANMARMGVDFELTVTGKTIPFLRDGPVNLFKRIMPECDIIKNPFFVEYNNAKILFRSYETVDDAKSAERDFLYATECNDEDKRIIDQLVIRTRKQVFFDFNPTKSFWIDDYINENNYLVTTWKDNPYLTPEQLDEFARIKQAAEKPNASVYDKYFYRVFYEGEYGDLVGNVFSRINVISNENYDKDSYLLKKLYGLDFGYSNDPCALVEVALYDKKAYVKELLYKNNMDDFQLADIIMEKCNGKIPIVCDFGGGGDARMANLYKLTKNKLIRASKGQNSVMNGVQLMQGFEFELCGANLVREFTGYEYKDDNFTEINNHTIDAARYAIDLGIKSGYFRL